MEALFHVICDRIEGFADIFGGVTQSPETRLSKILGDVEHHACSTVKNGKILVFDHKHHPFINEAENVVNSDCWVADSPVHNTVVELNPHIKQSICCWQDVTDHGKYRTISLGVFYGSVNTAYVQLLARSLFIFNQKILARALLNQLLADVTAPSNKYKFKYEALKILSSRGVRKKK